MIREESQKEKNHNFRYYKVYQSTGTRMSYLLRQSPKLLPFHLKYSLIQNYSFSSISGTVCKSCFLNRKSFYTSPVSDLNKRLFCSGKLPHEPPSQQDPVGTALLDLVSYETICSDTLEGLCEYFDELVELAPHLKNADITYSVSYIALLTLFILYFLELFVYRTVCLPLTLEKPTARM